MPVEFLIDRFAARPDEPAVASPAGQCTFRELIDMIEGWKRELARLELRPGAVVELYGDYSPQSTALFVALARHQAIVLPEWRGHGAGRERRREIASVEATFTVDRDDHVSFEPAGQKAHHELYTELRRRRHPGLVQFTSGTAGEPKAAVHDLTALLAKFHTRRPALSTLAFLLFDHLGGINTLLHTLSNGATLVATADRSPEQVCRLIEAHRVELLPATPTFFNLLLLSGAHHRFDLASLRLLTYGAEAMPAGTLERLKRAFPDVRLQQTYGMVELGALRTKSREDGSLWLKVGGEGIDTRVVDGVLQVRSPSILLGYLNAPSPITPDGWLVTGDLVEQDGDYLRILGRDSDLINVGGEKVYPAEVEGVIESMDGVLAATVYGKPNGLIGELVCARVSVADDAMIEGFKARLRRFCRPRLEPYKIPVKVQAVAEGIPEGAVKKSRHRVRQP